MDKMDRHFSPSRCGVSFHGSDEALHARPAENEEFNCEAGKTSQQQRR
jgi:hypothetical protein